MPFQNEILPDLCVCVCVCFSVKSLNRYILACLCRLLLDSVSDCHTYLVASSEWRSEFCFPLCRWSLLQFCLQLCLDSSVVFVFLACLSMLRPAACFCSRSYTSASSQMRQRAKTLEQQDITTDPIVHCIQYLTGQFCLPFMIFSGLEIHEYWLGGQLSVSLCLLKGG